MPDDRSPTTEDSIPPVSLTPAAASYTLGAAVSRFELRTGSATTALMDKKRILASAVVFLILAVLVYLQYRHWQSFDWGTFWSQARRIRKLRVLYAIGLIYFAYILRALRWKIFLKPVRPNVTATFLVSPLRWVSRDWRCRDAWGNSFVRISSRDGPIFPSHRSWRCG